MALRRSGWMEESQTLGGTYGSAPIETVASPKSIVGDVAKGGGMGFLETLGAGAILAGLQTALGLATAPKKPKKQKPVRETQEIRSEAAKNIAAGPAPMRGSAGLQGMSSGAVSQAAGNVYKQRSPYLG